MSQHSVAEAERQLLELIDRALAGEPVVITRDGRPVARITSIQEANEPNASEAPPPVAKRGNAREALAWLDARRVKLRGGGEDAVAIALKMRDEDWP